MAEELVILGSGPAGLTAAIYAARAGVVPLVLEGMDPGGQIAQTPEVENYPGFERPVSGEELVKSMRTQAERLGSKFELDEISSCDFSGEIKRLQGMSEEWEAKAVIIATGASPRKLGIPGEEKFSGNGVSFCATCDGAFYKGKRVAVIGGGDTALTEALYLAQIAKKVTVVHRRNEFRASQILAKRIDAENNIDVVWNAVPVEFLGDGSLSALRLKDVAGGTDRELQIDGCFVAIGHLPNTKPFAGQVDLDAQGYVVVGNGKATSADGVFAAGDVQERVYKQVVTATASGAQAALEAVEWLRQRK